MRNYATDSPQAMARVVVLALMADGTVDRSELNLLKRQEIIRRLGLSPEQFDSISYEFFEDLLGHGQRHDSGQFVLTAEIVASVLEGVRDSALQQKALRLILAIVNADRCLTADEAGLIAQAQKHWKIDLLECSDAAIPSPCRNDAGQPSLSDARIVESSYVYT